MVNENTAQEPPTSRIGTAAERTAPTGDAPSQSDRRQPGATTLSPAASPTDNFLVGRYREGDQNAATQLYFRYARRLTALVRRRCSANLARAAGVEDIVQSVFKTLFHRIGQGYYDIPDGDELWKLLLVITLNKIRAKATYAHAVKRDARRSTDAAMARQRIETVECVRTSETDHAELILTEILERLPPQHRFMLRLRIDGYTVEEIGSTTGRSRRSIERILQETREKLRGLLQEDN
jgi:RNA polymerase sigma-70 factor, ECF subfamily